MIKFDLNLLAGMMFIAVSGSSQAQWSSDPTEGTRLDSPIFYDASYLNLMPDNQGGAVLGWQNVTSTEPFSHSAYKRITFEGEVQWDSKVTSHSNFLDWDTISDGSGGAFLAYCPVGSPYIYAQHISNSGIKLWGPQGVRITALERQYQSEDNAELTTDGQGGIIVIWTDNRISDRINYYAQKLNAAGQRQWGDGGIQLSNTDDVQVDADIITDNIGGAIVCWTGSPMMINDTNVYGQRINGSGQLLWQTDDAVICNASGYQRGPRLIPDGQGGGIVCWDDSRSITKFFVQHIAADGTPLWVANGLPSNTDSRSIYRYDFILTSTGLYFIWANSANGSLPAAIRMQKMDLANGNLLWGNSGLVIPNTGKGDMPTLEDDGNGGIIAAWADARTTGQVHLYAQRLSESGTVLWNPQGMPVCTAIDSNVRSIDLLNVAPGECIVAWSDQRDDPKYSYRKSQPYAAYLQNDGTLRGTTAANDWQLWE